MSKEKNDHGSYALFWQTASVKYATLGFNPWMLWTGLCDQILDIGEEISACFCVWVFQISTTAGLIDQKFEIFCSVKIL